MKKNEFKKIITEALKTLALIKKDLSYIKRFDENTIGMVGFTIASHQTPGVLYVNPLIGLRFEPVEELYSKIYDSNQNKSYYATLASPLGYLMPCKTYKEWEFSDQANIKDVVDDLLYNIRTYGFSFIERHMEPKEILKCLEERKYVLEISRRYSLPIMYYWLGYKDKALEYMESICIISNRNRIDDQRYLEFAEKFKEYMKTH